MQEAEAHVNLCTPVSPYSQYGIVVTMPALDPVRIREGRQPLSIVANWAERPNSASCYRTISNYFRTSANHIAACRCLAIYCQ